MEDRNLVRMIVEVRKDLNSEWRPLSITADVDSEVNMDTDVWIERVSEIIAGHLRYTFTGKFSREPK